MDKPQKRSKLKRRIALSLLVVFGLVLLVYMPFMVSLALYSELPPASYPDLEPTAIKVTGGPNAYSDFMAADATFLDIENFELVEKMRWFRTAQNPEVSEWLDQNREFMQLLDQGLAKQQFIQPSEQIGSKTLRRFIGKACFLMEGKYVEAFEKGDFENARAAVIRQLHFFHMLSRDVRTPKEWILLAGLVMAANDNTLELMRASDDPDSDLSEILKVMPTEDELLTGADEMLKYWFQYYAVFMNSLLTAEDPPHEILRNEGLFYLGRDIATRYIFPVKSFHLQKNRSLNNAALFIHDHRKTLLSPWDYNSNIHGYYLPSTTTFGRVFAYASPNQDGARSFWFWSESMREFPLYYAKTLSSLRSVDILLTLRKAELENGELPDRLEDLEPFRQRGIPIDPFSGKPFMYNREEGIIYSVGQNGVNDSGDFVTPSWVLTAKLSPFLYTNDVVYSLRERPEHIWDKQNTENGGNPKKE